jgi:D-alanine-D-alanine ligase
MHLELDLGTTSRTDLILTEDGPVYLETNTVPGCTERSILPMAAELSGISGPDLVKKMLEIAVGNHLERWGRGTSAP